VVIAAVVLRAPTKRECDKQWDDAILHCIGLLSKPNPPARLVGKDKTPR